MATKMNADVSVISNSDLEITYMDGDLNIIQKLDDEPNDVGGLSADELKAKFDEGSNTIKRFINESLIPELLAADATEATRTAAEATRVSNEASRVSAEAARASAESTRQSAETTRKLQETQRASAEQARATAEASRKTAEDGRSATEALRVSAESARSAAEQARTAAEDGRAAAEETRVQNENARILAEQNRTAAETQRVAAEKSRADAETARSVWEEYSNTKSYVPGNKVSYQGSSYQNQKACTGLPPLPVNAEYWFLIAAAGKDGQGAGDMKAEEYDHDGAVVATGGIPNYISDRVAALRGNPGGLASLDESGRLPTAQLTLAVNEALSNVPDHIADQNNPHGVTATQAGAVSYSGAQSLTAAQQKQARENIATTNLRELTANVTLYVSPDGSDTTGDGSQSKPYRQIQKAIDSLPKILSGCNATINVAAGEYGGVKIRGFLGNGYSNKGSIRILGAGADTTHITGALDIEENAAVIYVRYFHISGVNSSANVVAVQTNTVYLFDCILDDTAAANGIYAYSCNCLIAYNVTISNKTGIGVYTVGTPTFASLILGANNAVCIQCGSSSSGISGLVIGDRHDITGTTKYVKERGGIIFVGGEQV